MGKYWSFGYLFLPSLPFTTSFTFLLQSPFKLPLRLDVLKNSLVKSDIFIYEHYSHFINGFLFSILFMDSIHQFTTFSTTFSYDWFPVISSSRVLVSQCTMVSSPALWTLSSMSVTRERVCGVLSPASPLGLHVGPSRRKFVNNFLTFATHTTRQTL